MIYFTSDLHLGHDREFIWGARGYADVYEMNEDQMRKFNEKVSADDECWILGDLVLGKLENAEPYLRRLQGKIHVVLGNHDTDRRRAFYESLGWDCQYASCIKYNKINFYLSHYPTICANLESESIWQTTVNLYGHTHQKTNFYQGNPYMYHVGVDSHDGYPVSIVEVINNILIEMSKCEEMLYGE